MLVSSRSLGGCREFELQRLVGMDVSKWSSEKLPSRVPYSSMVDLHRPRDRNQAAAGRYHQLNLSMKIMDPILWYYHSFVFHSGVAFNVCTLHQHSSKPVGTLESS